MRAIVFDGDDTLWSTEQLYDQARDNARRIVEEAGLDGARWEELERRIDVENVGRLGHSPDRFPASCAEAYAAVCADRGVEVDPVTCELVRAAARAVFDKPAPLLPHARATLAELRSRGYRLALLTKGDETVQRRRVDQSGLAQFFDVIEIVESKTPSAIRSVLERLGADETTALSVGNSLRSDVLPSLAAGVQPIWIDAHVWEYERALTAAVDERVIEASDLTSVLDLVS